MCQLHQSSILSLCLINCLYRNITSTEVGHSRHVSHEYLNAYPTEKDQFQRILQEESAYKRNYFKLDDILITTGEKQKMFRDQDFEKEFFIKRWRLVWETEKERIVEFINSGRKGGDVFRRQVFPPWLTMTFQTLKNISTFDQVYEFGKNYVGIGYVDFSPLLWGTFLNETCQKPMEFHGFEASAVVTLRNKVILALLKMNEISANSVLQIWFSSCIDKEAIHALHNVLNKMKIDEVSFSREELQIINTWIYTKPSIKKAKREFSACLESANFEGVWSMKFQIDRIKFLRYLFNGCIFVEESSAYCGNPTMFSELNGYTKIIQFENFFRSFNLGSKYFNQSQRNSLFDEICSITEDAIQQLRNRIQEMKLICYLYHKEVKMEELTFAASIRDWIKPYMINWSNVPDYLEKNAFIKFARTCSTKDTIHFVTFLNWVYYIFGAVHVDWDDCRDRLEDIYDMYKVVVKKGDDELNEMLGNERIFKYIEREKYKNPLNEINTCLAVKYRQKFEDFFLSDENEIPLNRSKESEHIVDAMLPHIFNQSCTTFSTAFTFNRNIKLEVGTIIESKNRFSSIKAN